MAERHTDRPGARGDAGETRRAPDRALILHPDLTRHARGRDKDAAPRRSPEARLEEAVGLAAAIDLDIVHTEVVRVTRMRPATLLGGGVVETFKSLIEAQEIGLVVVDSELSPVQQRNLEQAWDCKVIDRTALILEIFGERAATKEGTLQVELAHLTYQRSRLVRSWTHLERQRGGAGFLGGPGESQLEIDRRLIDERIVRLKKDLEVVRKRRELHRSARKRVPYPVTALVGYTNAGKSTLFNCLTNSKVFAEDLLFATLDPTMRSITLPSGREIILSDTVGFVSDLPTGLVAAFRATLEEVLEAEVIVHVRDISHPDTEAQRDDVLSVLDNLGLSDALGDSLIEVFNKADRLTPEQLLQAEDRADRSNVPAVVTSAVTGAGVDKLLTLLDEQLSRRRMMMEYQLDLADGASIAWLYERGEVVEREDSETTATMSVRLDPEDAARFERRLAGPDAVARQD